MASGRDVSEVEAVTTSSRKTRATSTASKPAPKSSRKPRAPLTSTSSVDSDGKT
jgi:hypothetical protein